MFCRQLIRTFPYRLISSVTMPVTQGARKKSGLSLKDKVVMITGSGTGIGAATAKAFAEEGSKVVIADVNADNVKAMIKVCDEICNAQAIGFHVDVTNEEQLNKMVSETVEKFGRLDVLVNNAGILTFGSLLKADVMNAFDKTLATNLRSCVYLTMIACPHLLRTQGNIINISSILGRSYSGDSKYMPYCVSKAGLDHFMFGAALELAPYGVRVNNVCPGPTKTEIFAKAGVNGTWEEISESFKLNNMSEPEEIADLILYLSSYKARSITGGKFYIDRGSLLMG
ncbi:uncharacterized protein LOC111360366 [Spodoptera litura]|uniref:Uncharacterized protein LOC111360366 n=1 Tax=Spodoptera litura TaxID=69820 RepID=A0A9J7EJ80_SPOLT|nr:uncharacterized protein LOC111360366 [Spodoptera litura]